MRVSENEWYRSLPILRNGWDSMFLGNGYWITKHLQQTEMHRAYLYLGWLSRSGAMTDKKKSK